MKKKNYMILIGVLLVLFIQKQQNNFKHCSLCDSLPYHEPCIINLSSGDIIPMTVYDPHPFVSGELAEEQSGSYSSIIQYPNYLGYRDTNIHRTISAVQIARAVPHRRSFCRSCRKLLDRYSQTGFVMADLHNPQTPAFFPLENESTITLRCYIITICFGSLENEIRISVQGTLN